MSRMNDFLQELRERRVIQVASVYVVGAWIVVQGAIDLFPVFGIPDWATRLLVLVALVGFPVTIVLSWAFQITSQGVVRDRGDHPGEEREGRWPVNLVVGLSLALLALFLLFRPQLTQIVEQGLGEPQVVTTGGQVAPEEPQVLHPQSIAVLPFVNMSSDEDTEYFSDGITEELLNVLANIPGLRVASRTSAFSFKDTQADIPTISRRLKVAHVLEGSVRRSGSRIRITAQLIDAREDIHLWSDTFDREMEEIFAIQDEISGRIVDTLEPTLLAARGGAASRSSTTRDMAAYDLYLRGRSAWNPGDPDALRRSIDHLQQSIERDEDFARSHSALARSLWSLGLSERDEDMKQRAVQAAERAIALDPMLREAHDVLRAAAETKDDGDSGEPMSTGSS